MMLAVKESNYAQKNNFEESMHCDLNFRSFDHEIKRAYSKLVGSLYVKFHDDMCKGKAIMQHKLFSVINAL